MNISIIIADLNRDYLERISEALQQYSDLTISICTDGDQFQSRIDTGRYDVALFDPDISEKPLIFQRVKLAICLYSDGARNRGMYADAVKVMKYQRISGIYKAVIREYAGKAGYSADFDNSQNTRVVSLYSPIGGSGKTAIALAVSTGFVNMGKSVLFLSVEQLGSSFEVNPKHENGLIELVECVENEKVDFGAMVKGLAKDGLNGMSYIEGFDRYVDYGAVSAEEVAAVLNKIKRAGIYDVIVLDMESHLGEIEKEVLSFSDHIIIVERAGELSAVKMRLFAEQAITDEYLSKMVRIGNFAENNTNYTTCLNAPMIGVVHNYGNLQLKSMIQAITTNCEIDIEKIL